MSIICIAKGTATRHDNAGRRWENHKPDTGTVGA